ncbi:torsin-1A-interacting protein 1-like [Uloborus diversus]|uniref:torsin-1A-interacting protein 1-like n=1 Tax=Uloborus diversus TaxID=327109 RepID=UPI002409D0F4|nr:torsin-1A-interacting protein 1-like [Uloborus diversus]
MPGNSTKSGREVETGINLRRRPLIRTSGNENSAPDPENTSSSEEEADINEGDINKGVDSSQEPIHTSSGKTDRLGTDKKKKKDKGPSRLYPEIPVLDEPAHEDKTSSKSSVYSLRNIIWPLLILIGYFLSKFLHPPETNSFVPPFDIDAVVSTMRRDFGSLPEKNFRVLKAALRSVNTDSEPKAPAVLLLVSPKGHESTSTRFAKNLAQVLDERFVSLSSAELVEAGNAKKCIDDTIRESVERKKVKVFLVSELQQLNFETTLIFHSFCDDQNAPYKRVVYVITVSCASLNTSEKWDKIGMDCLSQAWPDTPKDMKDPLVNRLTHSVIILNK